MKRKICIKTVIVVVLVISCFSSWSFADGTPVSGDSYKNLETFADVLNFAVSILSWIWVWFAKGAGEFLTNKWVYGEALKLDTLLWKYWNVVKNFANFGLGFYFLYVIFKSLIGKEEVTKKIKDMILWILIAGVGIQASWFLTAAIIDVSTVTLVAAGSFPSQVISKDIDAQAGFEKSLNNYLQSTKSEISEGSGRLFVLFPTNAKSKGFIETYPIALTGSIANPEGLFDNILPSADNVSGPLYYIGFSILNTNAIPSIGGDEKSWKAVILNTVLQGGTTIVYSLEMLILLIFSVMRVIYIWIFIILSPLVILLWSIQKASGGGNKALNGSFLGSVTEHINFSSFFLNVFKPTIVVLLMGLTVIFVSLMNKVILDNVDKNVDIGGVKVVSHKDDGSNINNVTYTTTLDSDLLHFGLVRASQTLIGLLLSIITVILVYVVIKVGFNMGGGKDFVSSNIKSVQDLAGKLLASTPIIPVAGYDKEGVPVNRSISAGSIFDVNTGKSKIFNTWKTEKENEIKDRISSDSKEIEKMFGIGGSNIDSLQEQNLRGVWSDKKILGLGILKKQTEIIKSFGDKSGFTLMGNTYNSNIWIEQFRKWLDDVKGPIDDPVRKDMAQKWQALSENEKNLEKFFNDNPTYSAKYADLLGYTGTGKHYQSFNSIKGLDVSKGGSGSED